MITPEQATQIADKWRPRFSSEDEFEASWTRYIESATSPAPERLEAWLSRDAGTDRSALIGVAVKPKPAAARPKLPDCSLCGKRERYEYDEVGGLCIGCLLREKQALKYGTTSEAFRRAERVRHGQKVTNAAAA